MKRKNILMSLLYMFAAGSMLFFLGCQGGGAVTEAGGKNIRIEFDQQMHSRVIAMFDGQEYVLGDFAPSEFVGIAGQERNNFAFSSAEQSKIEDQIGGGSQFVIVGESDNLKKTVTITTYDKFPELAMFQVSYSNGGANDLAIDYWVNNHYQVTPAAVANEQAPFWSYQSGSYESRPDWVLPLKAGFTQENYMGMNATDYGGGTPVVDVWRQDVGIGVGHVEMVPKLVSLPVNMPDVKSANLGVHYKTARNLKPGDSFATFKTFVNVHKGDYFSTLINYRRFMEAQGIKLAEYPESTYQPIWCAWGYERNFTMDQVYNTLPKAKELGFEWAVLDDGWQTAEGDWFLAKSKYPRGDRDMRKFTQTIRKAGLRPKIWWAPLAVDPGTELIKNHPEYLLLNEDGSRQKISWWDAFYLCPAYPPVQEYHEKLVEKIMMTWDYDGLKIDGQHLNGAPPCYNKAHGHAYPEESFEKVPEFFKVIYETALSIKDDAVVEICPCGAAYAFHTMPYMNQPVSSDPESSWQIRHKGKTLKALMGISMPYYGDHVELSDNRNDFATTVGIGGVVGSKFTWPVGAKKDSKVALTPALEKVWSKWVNIYTSKMLSKGNYRGELYDLGYDLPETHAVEKDGNMYYAFYADDFQGEVQLRGLKNGVYRVIDYENQKEFGSVTGPNASLAIEFSDHLLLEAVPQ